MFSAPSIKTGLINCYHNFLMNVSLIILTKPTIIVFKSWYL